jgi:hypothetical protein
MPSAGVITKETVNTNAISTYTPYLTVRDCGVYLYNAVDALFPLYTSCHYNTNVYNQAHTSGTITSYGDTGINGSAGVGNYGLLNLANKDDGYIVHSKYAITVKNSGGTEILNYQNNTTNPVYVVPSSLNTGYSIIIYYNGSEQT